MGMDLSSRWLQLGLNFAETSRARYDDHEMREDAMRVLGQYVKLASHIREEVCAETLLIRNTGRWVGRLKS